MAATRKPIRIGMADMHTGPREAIAFWLDARPGLKVVLQAGSVAMLQYKLEHKKAGVDVLLLELCLPDETAQDENEEAVTSPGLPGGNSIRMVAELAKQYEPMKIIVWSVCGHKRFIGLAMHWGASSYLCKTSGMEELETAICSVAEEGYYYTPEIAEAMRKRLVRLGRMADETGPFAALSREELECLRHWMKGLTAKQTGDAMYKSKDTVKGYRKAIYAKTGCDTLAELIQWARDNGMVVE